MWPPDNKPKNVRSCEERTVGRQSTERLGSVDKAPGSARNRPAVDPVSFIDRPTDVNGVWRICREQQESLKECIV